MKQNKQTNKNPQLAKSEIILFLPLAFQHGSSLIQLTFGHAVASNFAAHCFQVATYPEYSSVLRETNHGPCY